MRNRNKQTNFTLLLSATSLLPVFLLLRQKIKLLSWINQNNIATRKEKYQAFGILNMTFVPAPADVPHLPYERPSTTSYHCTCCCTYTCTSTCPGRTTTTSSSSTTTTIPRFPTHIPRCCAPSYSCCCCCYYRSYNYNRYVRIFRIVWLLTLKVLNIWKFT